MTLATVNSNVGQFGSTTAIPVVTVNAKGLVTAISTVAISGSLTFTGDVTGTGSTGGSTALSISSGAVTNTMLSGSIANAKLVNSSITIGTTAIALGAGSTTLAGMTSITYSGSTSGTAQIIPAAVAGTGTVLTLPAVTGTLATLAGTETLTNKTITAASNTISGLTNSNLSGTAGITNANLANSSVTVTAGTGMSGGGAVSLGGTVTLTNAGVLSVNGNTGAITGIATTAGNLGQFAATTSAQLLGVISDETGSGALVFATSPTLVTPVLGIASATSVNKVTITAPATGSTLTIAEGKTLTASNSLTLTGTDLSSIAFGSGGTVVYTSNKLNVHAATTSAELAGVISDETGYTTGALAVFSKSPSIDAPTITGHATIESVAVTGATGTGNLVFSISPTLTGTPLSTTAIAGTNTTQIATTAFVQTAVSNLVASAPAALDTLNELAAALGNDANFSTTISTSIGLKAPIASPTFTGTVTVPTLNLTNALAVAYGGTGLTTAPTNGQIDIGSTGVGFVRTTLTAGSGISITNAAGAITITATSGGGSVTSVGQTFTGGLISVTGSPITSAGTLALTVAGTSGGIPYFSSASTWATSALLAQYGIVYGGGAGAAPVATAAGTTGQVLTATTGGAPTWAAPAAQGTVTSVTGTAPVVSSGGNTPAISMAAATASVNGYMTSTYASKLDGIATGATANTGTVTGVTGTAPVVSSGGTAPAISMAAASSGVNGYMTGTYATKLDGIATGATANTGTVTSVSGTGTVSGLTLSGTVTGSGSLTLGGAIGTLNQNTTGNAATATTATNQSGGTVNASTGAFIGNVTVTGAGSVTLKTSGDITAYRSGGTTGVLFLNSAETRYVYWDGTNYQMPGANLQTNGYTVLNTNNYNSYAPTLTGTGASGTWGISVTGNAATVTGGITTSNYTTYAMPSGSSATNSVDVRAPIFYDSNNTAYYVDPASTSQLSTLLVVGDITVGQGQTSSNIYFYDSDEGTRRMHCNSNRIGFLNDSNGWGSYCGDGGEWYSDQSVRSPIFYDNNDTAYYVDPNSVSRLNNLLVNVGAVSNDNAGLRNVMPTGGSYVTSASSVAGAIVITLPVTVSPMIKFRVSVYTYDGLSFDIYCGGHNSSGYWYNTFAYMGTQNRAPLNVRFTYGNGLMYVYIGEIGQSWSYPQVFVTDVQVGYASYEYTNWDNGWTISFNSSTYNNVSSTHVVNPPPQSGNNSSAIYAPVLYDYNNTGYYVDPASTSRMNTINADSLYSYGNVTAYSDERLKKDWEELPNNFVEELAKIKSGTYTRIDSGERQVGVGAQSLQAILKEAVSEKEEYLGVHYGNAALASAVELAKEVVDLRARVAQLESLISKLIGD